MKKQETQIWNWIEIENYAPLKLVYVRFYLFSGYVEMCWNG